MALLRPRRSYAPTIALPPHSPSHQKLFDSAYGREWWAALSRGESPVRAYVSASIYARGVTGPMPGNYVYGYELSALRRFLPPGVSPADADKNAVAILEEVWLGLTRDELHDAKEFLDAENCPAKLATVCCAAVWAVQRTVARVQVFAEERLKFVYAGFVNQIVAEARVLWGVDEESFTEWMGEHETPPYDPCDTDFLRHYLRWRTLIDS